MSTASLWEDAMALWPGPCSKLPGYYWLCTVLVLVPQLQRLCCAYPLLGHLEVLLEIKDFDRLWHDGMDKLLPPDHDPARNKGMGCYYGLPNQRHAALSWWPEGWP